MLSSFNPSIKETLLLLIYFLVRSSSDKEKLSIIKAYSFSLTPTSNNSFLNSSLDILFILSIMVVTKEILLSSKPLSSKMPFINLRLLYLMKTFIPSLLKPSIYRVISSASINCPSKPTTSTSHWVNSRSLPNFTGPSLNTLFISYLLKGIFKTFLLRAINLAKGTVKSYLSPSFLSP